jgi:lysophospholipid acyltransferase (LPLAT)-like uncharacterized protein
MSADERAQRRITRLAGAGGWLLRVLGWTWRIRVTHDDGLRELRAAGRPFIFALWHGHLLPLLYHHRGQGVVILISEHGDGEIIARIAHGLGYQTVRGSTSRGAARALLALTRELEQGRSLAITPDGPRGPAKSIAPGLLVVAQRAGAPIIGVAASASSGWRLRSWDSFLIPRPFARVRVAYSDVLRVEAADARGAAAESDRVRTALSVAESRADG